MHNREIIGTSVSITDYAEVGERIVQALDAAERIYICCAPASTLVFARRNPELAASLRGAAVVTPDGMGVVWAARSLGEQINGRVYGPDLMKFELARAAARGTGCFLYGGHDNEALTALERALKASFPELEIVGSYSPPHRELTPREQAEVVTTINRSKAGIVWIGIGSPKQEVWMHEMRDRLEPSVLVGVGAAFDFLAGRVPQAPNWMQRSGLEWLYRLLRNPVRLGHRYLITLPSFVALVTRQRLRKSVG